MMIYFMTKYLTHFTKVLNLFNLIQPSHPAIKRRGYVLTMSLCTSQQRRRYVSNETLNDVSVERRQDISVVCFHNVLLECCEDISRGRKATSHQYHNVSNKSQMTSHWYATGSSQWYVATTSH